MKKIFNLFIILLFVLILACSKNNNNYTSPQWIDPIQPDLTGTDWILATGNAQFQPRYFQTSLVFNNKIWVIGGACSNSPYYLHDVWYSSDGIDWFCAKNNAAFSARYGHASVVFQDKMWVIGGFDTNNILNDVWNSSDGINWNLIKSNAGFAPRAYHVSIVYNNRIWVIGGISTGGSCSGGPGNLILKDVWASDNGIDWIIITGNANAEFTSQTGYSCIEYQNKMWIIGGGGSACCLTCGGSNPKSVWNSVNGINWNEITSEANFGLKLFHSSFVFKNKMYAIGGFGDPHGNGNKDVWQSYNGIDWRSSTLNAQFGLKMQHSSVIFNNKMWVIAGLINNGSSDIPTNDVWYSQ